MARAEELGASPAVEFLREIDAINLRARARIIELVRQDLTADLTGRKIAILGAAFKPDSDDVRDSPALDIAIALHAAGADVVVHDPKALTNAAAKYPALNYESDLTKTLTGAELVLHLTEWQIYRELDPSSVAKIVRQARIIDGRNMLDRKQWQAAGFSFRALGRGDQ
jgi:UDPglucose 6-dehydrogenase